MNIIAYRRLHLAKMIVPVGEGTPATPSTWAWLPPGEGNVMRIRIPVALLQQLLARTKPRRRPVAKTRNASACLNSLTLPLARVVIPLNLPRQKKESST